MFRYVFLMIFGYFFRNNHNLCCVMFQLPVIVNTNSKMPRNHFISFPELSRVGWYKTKCAYFVLRCCCCNPSLGRASSLLHFLSLSRSISCSMSAARIARVVCELGQNAITPLSHQHSRTLAPSHTHNLLHSSRLCLPSQD